MQSKNENTGLNKKLKIAVTGGIGSGKSVVCKYFESHGYLIINADLIAKNIMQNDESVKAKLVKSFGKEVFTGNSINKEFLSQLIFSDKKNLEKVNSIVHPVTIKKINEIAGNELLLKNIVFVESALIFEAKREKYFDYILLITSSIENRIKRITQRDNLDTNEIISRINSQLPDEDKRKKAHFTIDNDSSLENLYDKAKLFLSIFENLSSNSHK